MFNNLLESKAQKQTFFGGGFLSGVAHVFLVWGAIVATANAGQKLREAKEQKVDFVEVKKEKPKEAPKEQPKMEQAVPIVKGFQVLTAPINIPDVIPEIDLSRSVTNEADFTGKGVQGGVANGVKGGIVPVEQGQTYFEFQVEKPVVGAPGSAQPRYPEILKSAGVEGEVRWTPWRRFGIEGGTGIGKAPKCPQPTWPLFVRTENSPSPYPSSGTSVFPATSMCLSVSLPLKSRWPNSPLKKIAIWRTEPSDPPAPERETVTLNFELPGA